MFVLSLFIFLPTPFSLKERKNEIMLYLGIILFGKIIRRILGSLTSIISLKFFPFLLLFKFLCLSSLVGL